MSKPLFTFRTILVIATSMFMAFHTSIFIGRIEPNPIFAWTAALLIEGMLISLALMKAWASRLLLIPLFLISVMSASMSYVTKKEAVLESFLQTREAQAQTAQAIQMLKQDLTETQKQFDLGDKYTTKTLQRERAIKDRIAEIALSAKGQAGQLTLFNSAVFFVLVLVLQLVSVYTAMTLKSRIGQKGETQNQAQSVSRFPSAVSMETTETEITETWKPDNGNNGNTETEQPKTFKTEIQDIEKSEVGLDKNAIVASIQKLKKDGTTFEDLAGRFGVSKGTLSKLIQHPLYPVSDEIFMKVRDKLLNENSHMEGNS